MDVYQCLKILKSDYDWMSDYGSLEFKIIQEQNPHCFLATLTDNEGIQWEIPITCDGQHSEDMASAASFFIDDNTADLGLQEDLCEKEFYLHLWFEARAKAARER
jgi:hypothetical protein